MDTQTHAGGSPDLLSSIMGVAVRNEEKIATEDRQFCEERQTKLHATLHRLQWWYGLFAANAEPYRVSRNLAYEENGSVDKYSSRNAYHSEESEDYAAFEFLPFRSLNEVVELYGKAVQAFANDIIRHFNRRYGVSVPLPEIDREKLPMGFMPVYQTYVDAVIEHLGGKGFHEVAEDELIARFHKVVKPHYRTFKSELRGDKIVIPDVLWYDTYTFDDLLRLSGEAECDLNALCAGIMFGVTGSLNGGVNFLSEYNRRDIDVSRWYVFNIGEPVSVKFYKNRRVDFKFENAGAAERCWKKLRLDTLKITDGDE